MAPAPPFDLNTLQRDWIGESSGDSFYQRVQRRMAELHTAEDDARVRGVMILEEDPLRFAAALFAAVYTGVPVILANPKWRRVEWDRVVEQVNPALIFGYSPISNQVREGMNHLEPGSILIPTGGSSVGVKFTVHTWQTLAAACEGLSSFIGLGPVHSCCVLPLYHVSGLMQLVRSFVTGGRIVFPDFKDLQAGNFPDFPANTLCLSLVPTQLQRLMAQQQLANHLMSMRAIFVGGASTPSSVVEQARALQLPVVLSYGMTETAAMVAALPSDEFLSGQTNAGRPLSHAVIEVIREDGSVCSVGETGQIRIDSRSLFKGYHGGSESVSGRRYLSDDEGYFDSQGRLHIVGRSDRLIVSGGEKIDPLEVEQAILQTGAAQQVLVVGWPDPEWGQRLVAFYVPSAIENDAVKWDADLRANLVNYKVPKQMIEVRNLPLNERGKVDRKLMERLIALGDQKLKS